MKSLIKITYCCAMLLLVNIAILYGASAGSSAKDTKTAAAPSHKNLDPISDQDLTLILGNFSNLTTEQAKHFSKKLKSSIQNIATALENAIDMGELTKDKTDMLKGVFHLEKAADHLLKKDSSLRTTAGPYVPHLKGQTSAHSRSTMKELLEATSFHGQSTSPATATAAAGSEPKK